MKEFKIRLFKFEELSESAQSTICDKDRENVYGSYGAVAMESDAEERIDTLNAFCKLFGITYRIDYDHQYRFISWQFQDVDMNGYDWDADDITGKYLLRWLNRYYWQMRNHKTYSIQSSDKGQKTRVSRILFQDKDYFSFTGSCYDLDLFEKLYDWFEKPNWTISLHDLFEDCFSHFMHLWSEEDDYRMSDEYIGEMISINNPDAWYFEDGTEFTGDEDELEEYHNQSEDAA